MQQRDLDVYQAYERIDGTIARIESYRNDVDSFHNRCYVEVLHLAQEIGAVEEKPRTANRQINRSNVPCRVSIRILQKKYNNTIY